jgi:undecaprenyl diphosphate synthase
LVVTNIFGRDTIDHMHIGFILDGNRRWARKNGLPENFGHKKGADNLVELLKACSKHRINVVSAYVLSTENYRRRTKNEIKNLFDLLNQITDENITKFIEAGIKIRILGKIEELPERIFNKIVEAENKTKECNQMILQLCINYGGKDEIVRAVKKVLEKKQDLNEETISDNLDSALEPELVIRTGGSKRFSNFLLWQSSYSELYFTEVLWPDFNNNQLEKALQFYNLQQRNFGK